MASGGHGFADLFTKLACERFISTVFSQQSQFLSGRGQHMASIVKDTDWAQIEIDPDEKKVWVLERWAFHWTLAPGVSAWTLQEQGDFYQTLFTQIARTFQGATLSLSGTADLCKSVKSMPLVFGVVWMPEQWQHWSVFVRKMPAGSDPTTFISSVDSPNHTIYLDSADTATYQACNDAGKCRDFQALPHEFIHTLRGGNLDEYTAGSPYLGDTDSILNIGKQLRSRHVQLIVNDLNTMIPNCTFSYP
jgi:hypothetical protein